MPPWVFLLAYPASRHPSIMETAFGRLYARGGPWTPLPSLIPLWMGVWRLGRQGGNPTVAT